LEKKEQKHPPLNRQSQLEVWIFAPKLERGRHDSCLQKRERQDQGRELQAISPTSCAGKLIKRLVNSRISWHLKKKQLLRPEQAGFRQHRISEDQITYIAQEIEDAFQEKKNTIAVWLDMERAFDKVWKDGLKFKL
jgi:hypothetical protein